MKGNVREPPGSVRLWCERCAKIAQFSRHVSIEDLEVFFYKCDCGCGEILIWGRDFKYFKVLDLKKALG